MTASEADNAPSLSWIGEFHSGVSGTWGEFIRQEASKSYFKSLLVYFVKDR